MQRRTFLRSLVLGGTAFTIGGAAWARVFASAAGGPGPYGPLGVADKLGWQLPTGFSSRIVATTGVSLSPSGYV